MTRIDLNPIDLQAQFGASKRSRHSLAHPVPTAKALNMRRQDERLQVATSRISNGTTREPYRGGELMASPRAGAMDAQKLPSVLMGERTYPKATQP